MPSHSCASLKPMISPTLYAMMRIGKNLPSVGGDLQRPVTIIIRGRPFDFFASTTSLDNLRAWLIRLRPFAHDGTASWTFQLQAMLRLLAFRLTRFYPRRPASPASPFRPQVQRPRESRLARPEPQPRPWPKQTAHDRRTHRTRSGLGTAARYRASTSILSVPKSYESAISTAAVPHPLQARDSPHPSFRNVTANARLGSPSTVGPNVPPSSPYPRTREQSTLIRPPILRIPQKQFPDARSAKPVL